MLIRFVVNNFLSFGEEKEFNMIAGSFKTHKHHVEKIGKLNVLKSAAIYGANGAGKSNFVKAIEFLQQKISDGNVRSSVNDKKFKLNDENKSKPISFEIEFTIKNKIFVYGVSFDNNKVVEEWLYESGINVEDKLVFERSVDKNNKSKVKIAPKYYKTQKQKLLIELMEDNLLKTSDLFLGKDEELKIDIITKVRNSLMHDIVIIHPGSKYQMLVPTLTQSDDFKVFANELLKTFDTGVTDLAVENIAFDKYFGDEDDLKNEIIEAIGEEGSVVLNTESGGVLVSKVDDNYSVKKVVANHLNKLGSKIAFDLMDESDGTQRLLDIIPALNGILNENITFIIDEIDQSLHPSLLKALIKKTMSSKENQGQLIFSTHESNLLDLDIFRQDEIWFAEKNKNTQCTELYSLSEFKPRYDLDIRKGYLKGRFGGIPFLASLDELNWISENA